MSLDMVEAVIARRDSMGLVLCGALLSVPLLLSLRPALSPHGVSVAPHHSAEVHGQPGGKRDGDNQVPVGNSLVQVAEGLPLGRQVLRTICALDWYKLQRKPICGCCEATADPCLAL